MAFAGKSNNRYINMCIISLDILMIIPFRELNCVYQFHGCYFHGCPICKPDNRDDMVVQYVNLIIVMTWLSNMYT